MAQAALIFGLAWAAARILEGAGLVASGAVLPATARLVGLPILALGLAAAAWTLRTRPPGVMLRSTAVTLRKILARTPRDGPGARTEPFVATGPYRYVRNPLYLGAILVVLGWGLWASSATFLLWSVVLLLWFGLVLVPAEEREMTALFGADYARYRERVPMLVPRWRRWEG